MQKEISEPEAVIGGGSFGLPCKLSQIVQRLGRRLMEELSWDFLQNISQHHQRHPVRETLFKKKKIPTEATIFVFCTKITKSQGLTDDQFIMAYLSHFVTQNTPLLQ